MDEVMVYIGTGRRKTAVARVRLTRGDGKMLVNKRDLDEYFVMDRTRNICKAPLKATKTLGKFDVFCNVKGGGTSAQADAVMLGVARALRHAVDDAEPILRENGFLTRDSREVERKKYGRAGARRSYQFSKR
jgi:small subunit ribosomal protein S9